MTAIRTIFIATMMTIAAQANAHSGGLDKNGCHAGSKPYHCHRAQAAAPQAATEGQMLTGTINHVPPVSGGPALGPGISVRHKLPLQTRLSPPLVWRRLGNPFFLRQLPNGHVIRRKHPLQHR